MGGVAFGAPVQDEAAGEQPQSATGDQPVPQEVDINDPLLTSEVITDDSAANSYATLPPIPDGKYRAKIRHRDMKGGDGKPVAFKAYSAGWMNPPVPYLATAQDIDIIDLGQGKYDGYKLTDFFVKTLVDRTGTSQAATVIRATGNKTPAQATQRQYMDLLLKVQASEPELGVETAWEWSCEHCQEKAEAAGQKKQKPVIGMHKFPNGKVTGTKDPQMKCDGCGQYSVARARVVGYLPLTELPKR